jgi:hypothetical protein
MPTAVQALADVHDTPFSWLIVAPAGVGVGWTAHVLPFQRSTKPEVPTAVQAVAEVHDTPNREAPPDSFGVGWITHASPFQRSTNGPASRPEDPAVR